MTGAPERQEATIPDEQQIGEALHASRVVPLDVPNPHGPLGLEQLAEAVGRATAAGHRPAPAATVQRPLALPTETWAKLDDLARAATKFASHPISASDVAATLIERSMATE